MEKLKSAKKITIATLKSFANRNADKLFTKNLREFNGMTDGVEEVEDKFTPTKVTEDKGYYQTGIQGIYTVGSSRDYFQLYEEGNFLGIKVYNCCGSSILAIKK